MDLFNIIIAVVMLGAVLFALSPILFKDKFAAWKAQAEARRLNKIEELKHQADAAERKAVLDEQEALLRARINKAKQAETKLARVRAGGTLTQRAPSLGSDMFSEPKKKKGAKVSEPKWTIGFEDDK